MVDPLSYFSFQPVLHDRCNKGYSIWDGTFKIILASNKKKSSLCSGGSSFPHCPSGPLPHVQCRDVRYNIIDGHHDIRPSV